MNTTNKSKPKYTVIVERMPYKPDIVHTHTSFRKAQEEGWNLSKQYPGVEVTVTSEGFTIHAQKFYKPSPSSTTRRH